MELIALRGKANVGKTTTLKLLMGKMIEEGATVAYCCYKYLYLRMINSADERWYTRNGNIQNLTILFQYKKKQILVTSVGDAIPQIRDAVLGTVERIGIDISTVVCACRSHTNLQAIFPGADIEYIEKYSDAPLSTETICKNDSIICQKLFQEVLNT